MRKTLLASCTAVLLATLPTAVFAHAHLEKANPAPDSTVAKPQKLTLDFSEDLVAPLSNVELVMTSMPGMSDHKPMPIKGFQTSAKGKTMTVALPRPLPSGSYTLTWHAVTADQHRVEGSYTFTVR
ncbi:copper homeostasis periplasmic binding protein CopC [Novosphingobium organovorum]|uniref:copper homeostasis periplasmic binding protein CopC n=1 Tax=Novosphingobium organovorum TaxID=2930092 RepID=UPI002E158C9E